jgi:hypothetical protein
MPISKTLRNTHVYVEIPLEFKVLVMKDSQLYKDYLAIKNTYEQQLYNRNGECNELHSN